MNIKKLKNVDPDHKGWVYILKGFLKNKRIFYVGSTTRGIYDRLLEHFEGKSNYTSKLSELEVAYVIQLPPHRVRSVEAYLKKNRRVIYQLIGKELGDKRIENFYRWLKIHGIKIGFMGSV